MTSTPNGSGRSAALTATVLNVMRFSTHDGPGIRTTVFLKGCPLACWWCHNPESQSFRPEILYFEERCLRCGDCQAACPQHAIAVNGFLRTDATCRRCGHCAEVCPADARRMAGRRTTLAELLREVERDLVVFEESGGGVSLSGGEPTAQPGFAAAFLDACRERGIHTAIETCGATAAGPFLEVALAAELVLFDLKMTDPKRHKLYTGRSNSTILQNLRNLAHRHPAVTVRIPVVPGINDSEDEAGRFAELLSRLRIPSVELLPYHRIGAGKYRRLGQPNRLEDTPEPSAAGMSRFRDVLAQAGLNVIIGG